MKPLDNVFSGCLNFDLLINIDDPAVLADVKSPSFGPEPDTVHHTVCPGHLFVSIAEDRISASERLGKFLVDLW